jgi:hypothetical protein
MKKLNAALFGLSVLFSIGSQAQVWDYSVQFDIAGPSGNHNTTIYFEDSLTWTTDVPTFGFDNCCDALFIQGATPISYLYTVITEPVFPVNNEISINGLPPLTASYSVPMKLLVGTSGSHNISANLVDIPANMTVHLEDQVLANIQDLAQNNQYTFNANVGAALGRFIVHFNLTTVGLQESITERWRIQQDFKYRQVRLYGLDRTKRASAQVYSVSGTLVSSTNLNSSTIINLSGLDSGLYILQVTQEGQAQSFKLLLGQ